MPIYEYQCQACRGEFETLVASAKTRVRCPACGSGKVKRMISTFAAHSSAGEAPCASGLCPAGAAPSGACASGKCPFS
jgi:putative FmdB family regulatory protein